MTSDLKKIWAVFTPSERRKSTWMLLLVVLMAAAETLGVLSIMPFLSVLGRPAIIQESPLLKSAYDHFGCPEMVSGTTCPLQGLQALDIGGRLDTTLKELRALPGMQ